MDSQRSVLIVDSSEESREVLQTALERRGMRIFSTGRVQQGIELARRHHPDLIVLDLELDESGGEDFSLPLAAQSGAQGATLVLLGTVHRQQTLPAGEFVAKPYHYGPLIRRIEELLEATPREPQPCRRCS
ncbi:MAG: response regulator [Thermoguttaceae bacterium]